MAGIVQTVVRGAETTENIPAERRKRDISDRIVYLNPDAAPFTVVMMRTRSRVATNSKFEWMESDQPARWDAVNDATPPNSAATTVTVDNAKFFSVGDIVLVPRTGERFRVSGVTIGAGTIDIVRSIGPTAAADFLDNDELLIIGNAYPEGGLSGTPKSVAEALAYNYTQIVRTPLQVTRTQQNSENYGGKTRARLRMEKAIEHKVDLERTALFGERAIDTGDTSAGAIYRYTGGLLFFLKDLDGGKAKVKDFGGLVTEPELEDWMEDIFAVTGAGDSRTLLASPKWVTVLDQLAMGRLQVVDRAETYGVTVKTLVTSHGSLNIVKHRLLMDNPAPGGGGDGYSGYALALDFERLSYRFLEGSNTSMKDNIQAPDFDGFKDEYLTEMGWEIGSREAHGVATGATA
jgi:hypothetical protein